VELGLLVGALVIGSATGDAGEEPGLLVEGLVIGPATGDLVVETGNRAASWGTGHLVCNW